MRSKNKFLLKNIGLFTIGSFGSKVLSFLLVPLYTAVLSPFEYGIVDLLTSTVSLLIPILLLSIFDATLRFGMDSNYQKTDVISTSINIMIKGIMVLIVAIIVISTTHLFNISNTYFLFLCIFFIFGALNQILNLYLRTKNQIKIIIIGGIICTLITCISNVILLLILKYGILGYMISNIIGVFTQNIYQLFVGKVYKDIKFKNYNDLSKIMLGYSIPLIMNSVSWWINNASDRYILTFLKGVAENGVYSVSYKIPTVLSMAQGIFYNAWSISALVEFDEKDKDGFIGVNYSLYSFISLMVCSILLILNIPIATVLYKNNYFNAWRCVPFLLMGTVFSGISQFEGSLFAATKNTKLVAKTTMIGAGINIVCNVIFIYYLGNIGAALSTLFGYIITWGLRTRYLQHFIKMKVNWKIHFFSILIVIIQSCIAVFGTLIYIQIMLFLILIIVNSSFFINCFYFKNK